MLKLIRTTLIALVVFAFALPAVAGGAAINVNGVKAAPPAIDGPVDLR